MFGTLCYGMRVFFLFFVACASFASTIPVPCAWSCYEEPFDADCDDKVLTLKGPFSEELRTCEVRQRCGSDAVVIQNDSGSDLQVLVNRRVVGCGDWIFSAKFLQSGFGQVSFEESTKGRGCVVVQSSFQKDFYDFGGFRLWKTLNNTQYEVDREELTIRKFLGFYGFDCELFVSATIVYRDLKTVMIRCGSGRSRWDSGKDGLMWVRGVVPIAALCVPDGEPFSGERL